MSTALLTLAAQQPVPEQEEPTAAIESAPIPIVESAPPASTESTADEGGFALKGPIQRPAPQEVTSPAPAAKNLPSFYLFNGAAIDATESEWWQEIATVVPHEVRIIEPRDAAAALQELTAERTRRDADRDTSHPPLFVFVYHLAKFRDLRKGEDDYGFGGFGSQAEKPIEPGKLFTDLLTNGPECGIHFVVWADSGANVDRWLGRNSIKELEHRVVFQMNAADSSNLIDTPAASRLGVHRALIYSEESGTAKSSVRMALPATTGSSKPSTPLPGPHRQQQLSRYKNSPKNNQNRKHSKKRLTSTRSCDVDRHSRMETELFNG